MMTQLATEKESATRVADGIMPRRQPNLAPGSLMPTSDRTRLTPTRPGARVTSALLPALLAFTVAVTAGAAEPAARNESTVAASTLASGTVVAIGGALRYDNAAVWSRLVALAGGPGSRYVVFGTASGNPNRAAERVIAALAAHGARAEHIPVAPELPGIDLEQAVRDPEMIARVRAARGVFFTGGAQERIVDTLQPGGEATPLLVAIRAVLDGGGVIAGTSAGAAVMSRVMFRDAPDLLGAMKGTLRPGHEVDRGLGFAAPDLFVDQHFLRRGRLGRMLPLLHLQGIELGIGVEENSAAILRGRELEIVGNGGALVVDLAEARSDPDLGAFNVTGVRLTYLGDGDRMHLDTRAVVPSVAKRQGSRIDPRAKDFEPSLEGTPFLLDVLGDGAVLRGMQHVLDGPRPELLGLAFDARPEAQAPRELGFEFRFYRGPDTAGWFTSAFGDEAYTVENVRLDVRPVHVAQPLYRGWKP
jgi:cyanophycinase